MSDYRDDEVYKVMVALAESAGIKVIYKDIPEDIYGRTDGEIIEMPSDPEAYPDDGETASLVLGHEIGHIISGLHGFMTKSEKARDEAACDLIGVYLLKLAEKIYEHQIALAFESEDHSND